MSEKTFQNYLQEEGKWKTYKSEIPKPLAKATAKEIYENAETFYEYYNTFESVIREEAFCFASEELKIDYDKIYLKWLGEAA